MDNPPKPHTDRNLLLGILALQVDFITRDELLDAASEWIRNKSRSLDGILLEQGALKDSERQLLLPLVEQHIANHEGDPARSLAALSSIGTVAEQLRDLDDDQIHATLSVMGQNRDESLIEPTIVHESSIESAVGERRASSAGNRFRILRPHAKGGLGEVSVAKDIELNRDVALKEIQSRFADAEASRSRFLLEAEITGGLEHPGIVPVYGLGRYDDGRPFYAMRFIRGDSLREATDRFHRSNQAAGGRQVRRRLLKTSLEKLESIATPYVAQTTVDRNTQKALTKMGDVILRLTPGDEDVIGPPQVRPSSEKPQSGVRLAQSFFSRALEIAEQLVDANPHDSELQRILMGSLLDMGLVRVRLGHTEEAFGFYSRALEIGNNLLETTPDDVEVKKSLSTVLDALGSAWFTMGQPREALERYERSLKITSELAAADPDNRFIQRQLAGAYGNIGLIHHVSLKNLEVAIDYYTKSLQIRERLLAGDPTSTIYQTSVVASLHRLGNACREADRLDDAAMFLGRMSEISRAQTLADPSDSLAQEYLAHALRSLANLKVAQRQLPAAVELYQEALAISEQLTAADPSDTRGRYSQAATRHELGDALLEAGRPGEALEHITKSLSLLKTMSATDSSSEELRRSLIATYDLLERARDAAQDQLALGDWDRLMEQPPRERIALLYERGFASVESGNLKEAVLAADALQKIAGGARHANLYNAACIYGECVRNVESVAELSEKQKLIRKQLLADSMAALRRSVEAGWYDLAVLRTSPSLAPVRRLPEFEEVLKFDLPEKRRAAMQQDIDEAKWELAELDQKIAEDPDNPVTYFQRARAHERLRNWRQSAADYHRAAELRGLLSNRLQQLHAATLFILAGELEKYRATSERTARMFQNTLNPAEADIACKSQALLPGAFDSKPPRLALVELAVEKNSPEWFPSWGASTLALYAYRQGEWEEALEWIAKIDKESWYGKPWAIGLVVRAMAEFRLGQVDKAKRTLQEADDAIPADLRILRTE